VTTRIYVEEAGCKRRQLDIETIKKYLQANGHALVENPEDADRILVSTCAFKKKEEDDSVKRLRFFRKFGREIVVFGCLPDIASDRYREFADFHKIAPREIEHIDRYFDHDVVKYAEMSEENLVTRKNLNIVKSLKRKIQSGELFNREFFAETAQSGVNRLKDLLSEPQESWFLFVCRGCHGKCSYCAIRRSVGPVKSKPVSDVVAELRRGLRAGYRDFSILGDDPGCYGLDNGGNLPDLLRALRLSLDDGDRKGEKLTDISFHIKEIHPKFLIKYERELLEQPFTRLVKSMLCPVQSGSDRILELMQREHTAGELQKILRKARQLQPQMNLETQMIVGFPSESESEFSATLDMVRQAQFNSVVVFPYHDKEGTPASEIQDKVSPEVIRKRMQSAFSYFRKHGIKAYYRCP